MTERKRRSEDGRDADAQPPPSLAKKRHTAKADDFEALSAEFDETAAMLDLGAIREFQKEAIWRQMQEYKRDAQRAEQHSANIEQRQAAWEERIAGVCTMWDQAIRDLDAIVNEVEPAAAAESGPQTWLDIMLPRKPPASSSSPSEPAAEAASAGMERFSESVNNVLRQLQAKSKQSEIDWQAAIDRLSRTRATQADMEEMKAQVALLSRQLTESKEMLELRESELRRALKQLDRRICPTLRKDNGDAGTSGANESKSSDKADAAAQDQHAASPAASTPGTSSGGVVNGAAAMSATALQAQQDREQFKLLAESRLAEIEQKVQENTDLQMQVDSLKLQIAAVPDYVISETPLYKQVEGSRDYYAAQTQRLQAEVERLFGEVSELKTSRTEFEEGLATESAAQRQALEAEIQRLHGDLVRVRHHRDQVQRELEERRAQDAVEDQKSAELKLLSDVRRERMNALISENKRLLACIAVLKGDRAAFETYTDAELSKTTAVADELRAKLEQVARRERQLAGRLEALSVQDEAQAKSPQQASESATARLASELQNARDEVERLQLRMRKYEEILGGVAVSENGSIVDETAQTSELVAKQKRLDELTLERDGLAKTSEMMERELQTICETFARLEEQNTSKVWDLSAKEQAISRVIAEKSKYEEKFIGLNKDREAQRAANQALRNQNAKQLEHIKAIEERDRALAQQLSLAGKEAEKATLAWQSAQTKLQEAQQRAQELEEQARALEEQARVATQALNERTEALGAVEHEKRRMQETLDAANRRLAEAEKVTDQSGLAKLCADYKALLKCPTCRTNFKSHVLMRCMHVFCKQCLDSRIETRQRKCPSCSEPFGAKDVRQIYL
ncbi:E3 ubiquitin-protein ligase bre1 [Coemansia sp. RSA 989]|nr:E3 ubiquitin-protein ligase bre1 [Coemansia sp. RSA 1086]KAJ1753440.1 E3 ubiquitin-protein ligase bre1 [Coemansia sp. RSA 1821]KAJ1863804.1 E3 ubiquitin-protein ligase bre1 [Coemansia sp. RSA 989]KAJ1872238.1 E3 ubiquitin-protein ligase bre1 [Coemansia sp. RSA 990]KAJ2676594.1 E3 ubiquitin-protein ligase bre1 [Coemansia sp. RSA 1085]